MTEWKCPSTECTAPNLGRAGACAVCSALHPYYMTLKWVMKELDELRHMNEDVLRNGVEDILKKVDDEWGCVSHSINE